MSLYGRESIRDAQRLALSTVPREIGIFFMDRESPVSQVERDERFVDHYDDIATGIIETYLVN